jgi:hypothetical protein
MQTRRVDSQVAGSGQHSRPAARSQWFTTVLSGSTTLRRQRGQAGIYGAIAADASVVGHLSDTTTGLVTQQHHAVPLNECKVTSDKTIHAHTVEDIICYS